MKKIITFLRNTLEISISEAKTVLFLFGIIAISLIAYFGFEKYTQEFESGVVVQKLDENLKVEFPKENKQKWHNYEDYDKKSNFHSYKENLKISYHNFDPNTANEAEFVGLGLPKFIAQRIVNYRNKGGKFKVKEDFKKIYGIRPDTYEKLLPFITIEESPISNNPLPSYNDKIDKKKSDEIPKKEIVRAFDINTADTTTLKNVKGIGKVFANRIIKYRDLLGGFINFDQVAETYGVSPEIIEELKKNSYISKSNIKKIDINNANLQNFKHVYLKSYLVKNIIAYRNEHGRFNSINDLKNIKTLDEELIKKLEPYLEFK
jgi:competence protein ComEA